MRSHEQAVQHLGAVLLFAALAIWSTFPLVLRLNTTIPGTGAEDNVAFLWNLWSFATSIRSGTPFWTDALFFPLGSSLALHTHATFPSFVGWLLLPFVALPAAHNIVLLLGLTANGYAMFVLAGRYVRQYTARLAAGVVFACSAFVQVRLYGHFNLLHAWVLPVVVLALLRFVERPTYARGAGLAVAMAVTTYTDYYYAVYAGMFLALYLLWTRVSIRVRAADRSSAAKAIAAACLVLLLADAVLMVAVLATGGFNLEFGTVRMSLRSLHNPLTVFWLLLTAAVVAGVPARLWVRPVCRVTLPRFLQWAVAALTFCALISPLLYASAHMVIAGDYVSPPVLWRSSPRGVDLATLFLGNPRHLFAGPSARSWYSALEIDIIEQGAWLGLAGPLIVLGVAFRRTSSANQRFWFLAGAAFFVLALGPFLRAAGLDLGLPLPQALMRYVPVLSNARIPGRAMVVVQLSVAILTAISLSHGTRHRLTVMALILLLLDAIPAPAPLATLPQPDAVDRELGRRRGDGAVVELPTGLRDGFADFGWFDHRALVHQIVHGRPIVGGFVARLTPAVRERYQSTPILAAFVSMSQGDATRLLTRRSASEARELGIRFVVINRDTFPANVPLTRYDMEAAGFSHVTTEGPRELYALPN